MDLHGIIVEEINKAVSEEHWAEFGSWHNKFDKDTEFEFDGHTWKPKEKDKKISGCKLFTI